MKKIEVLNKKYTIDQVMDAMRGNRVVILPFVLNEDVFVINNKKPQKKMVTDISLKGIQLNGVWTTWEELEAQGGLFESEFEALSAIGNM